jgi:hypothetical protein
MKEPVVVQGKMPEEKESTTNRGVMAVVGRRRVGISRIDGDY